MVDGATHLLAERRADGGRERVVVGEHEAEARGAPCARQLGAHLVPEEQLARRA